MIKLQEQYLLDSPDIRKAEFENRWWFSVEDVSAYLKEDLDGVESIALPVSAGGKRQIIQCATVEQINNGRKQEELSDFNKKLIRARYYKKKGS